MCKVAELAAPFDSHHILNDSSGLSLPRLSMTVPSDVTQSATYKRAHKHYLKTRQPISDDSDLTPFRIQEKRYKTKFPPPHLDDALDPWAMQDDLPESLVDLGGGWGRGSRHTSGSTTSQVELVHTQDDGAEGPRRRRRAYVVSSHPGTCPSRFAFCSTLGVLKAVLTDAVDFSSI